MQVNSSNHGKPGADFIPIGAGVRLMSVESLAAEFRVETAHVEEMLRSLGVPVLQPGPDSKTYYNLSSLELMLHAILRPPGRQGWRFKNRSQYQMLAELEPLLRRELESVAAIYYKMDRDYLRQRCQELGMRMRSTARRLLHSAKRRPEWRIRDVPNP